jgi:voltage-gated potassium channel
VKIVSIKKLVALNYKFIHFEIALLVLLSGILQIHDIDKYTVIFTHPKVVMDSVLKNFTLLTISSLTHNVIGLILVVMSIGLFLRSRLFWILTFVVSFLGLMLESYYSVDVSTYLLFYEFIVLVALFVFRDAFYETSFTASTLFALAAVVLTLGFGTIGSYALGSEFQPPIKDLLTGLYFTVVLLHRQII